MNLAGSALSQNDKQRGTTRFGGVQEIAINRHRAETSYKSSGTR